MVINWFTIFILLCITVLVITKKKIRYLDAFVFFIPFNATVIFFTPDKTAINLPFILFFFASISFFLTKGLYSKFSLPKKNNTIYTWLFVIAFIALLSQIMPFIINGKFNVLDRYNSEVFWAKESIFGVKIEIEAKIRAYTGFSRWAGAGFINFGEVLT